MYRIHAAAEQAGLSAQLVRAWERRYGLLAPERTEAGYRLYSDEDVTVLRGAKSLVDQGRSISDVARLGRADLLRIGKSAALAAAPMRPSLAPLASSDFPNAAIEAITALDGARVESLLLHATRMGSMSSVEICQQVLLPLLREIGNRWQRGSLPISAEHFGSGIVRRHLHLLVQDESRRNKGAACVVCACPEGELHEGGLLSFALHAATLGWGIVYLGASTPIDEIIAAANRTGASAIGVSMTVSRSRKERSHLASRLATWRSKHAGRRVWLGGGDAEAHRQEMAAAGIDVVDEAMTIPRAKLAPHSG